jgi:VanZ family protein
VPDLGISFADKVFHFGAYAVMTFIWFNYFSSLKMTTKTESIIIAVIIAVIFGMIIELLQGTITESRQADFNDVIANNVGILISALILWFLPTKDVKKY